MTHERTRTVTRGPHTGNIAVLDSSGQLTALEKCLLNEYQRGFPLSPAPYAEIAGQLGVSESEVIRTLESLQERGYISRIGPVFAPKRAGSSTLAAMAVPGEQLEAVAAYVSRFTEVNHNYEREHAFNLWFVVTTPEQARVQQVLDEIESGTGIAVLDLPLERPFYIDLGFPLWC
jgi:DNA-binding Lrp family transcriptional regulator